MSRVDPSVAAQDGRIDSVRVSLEVFEPLSFRDRGEEMEQVGEGLDVVPISS